MARHASFLSFFHSIPFILHHSLRPLRPLTPTPRSTCTWGSRSRSSACSPRASPQDSLSGPPRRSPRKRGGRQIRPSWTPNEWSAKTSPSPGDSGSKNVSLHFHARVWYCVAARHKATKNVLVFVSRWHKISITLYTDNPGVG